YLLFGGTRPISNMKLPSLSFLTQAVIGAGRRFPGTLLAALVATIAVLLLIENENDSALVKAWMLAQLGLPLFTGLTALAESRGWRMGQHLALLGGGLVALGLYGWSLPADLHEHFSQVDAIRFVVLLLVVHLFVAVAPYLNQLRISDFWNYNRQLFANIVVGAAYTFILWGGLALALLSIGQLFNLHVAGENYARLFVMLAGIFNTVFFLHHFPAQYALDEPEGDYNAVFKNLCKYILIPIVGLYFLILYAYSAKILVHWELPNGWVTGLVLGFSVAGIFTYLLNYLLPLHDDSALPRVYRRWFWWILLPMVGLLFVALLRRVGDYGITEPRYFGLLLGAWLLVCCGYFMFSKLDNIKFIPISLGLLGLISVFGPLSAFQVSTRSQAQILKILLIKNGRFVDGKAQPGKTELSDEGWRISNELNYLAERKALNRIRTWFPAPIDTVFQGKDNPLAVSQLQQWLNLGSAYSAAGEQRLWVRTNPPIDQTSVLGFSTFYRLQSRNTESNVSAQGRYFRLSGSGTAFEWRELRGKEDLLLDSFDLRPSLRAWTSKRPEYEISLPPDEATIDLVGKTASLRLLLEEGEVMVQNGMLHAEFLNGLIFVRENPKRR
ncbi:MAG: DUF4153 domain-containing protein, partial [Saprospiraceae bacterium]